MVRLGPLAWRLAVGLRAAAPAGVVPASAAELAAADRLVARGLAHPGVRERAPSRPAVDIVVPAYGRADLLARCLDALGPGAVVVDDASPTREVGEVALAHGARLLRHEGNRGPAAARTTGLAATGRDVVAFVDADCVVPPGWLDRLLPLFDDPRVGVVAPRVVPHDSRRRAHRCWPGTSCTRSALDMGPWPELVRPGARLGFLPSATLLVRRAALAGGGFDAGLRLGEDVDLVWRLADAGWHVRYEPSVRVRHEMRVSPAAWARRRFEYGTSAGELDRRHPGRLAPARVSAWNVAAGALALAGHPAAGAAVVAGAAGALGVRLRRDGIDPFLAPVVVGSGLVADAAAVGHALRREWWPLGWAALGAALLGRGRGARRTARAAAAAVLAPVALEWWRQRPDVDPLRYAALRLVEDAAYGSGVLLSATRTRRPGVVLPVVKAPRLARTDQSDRSTTPRTFRPASRSS